MRLEILKLEEKPETIDLRHVGGDLLKDWTPDPALLGFPEHVLQAMADMNLSPAFAPPRQSRATRYISLRGRGSYRGAVAAQLSGVSRMIVFESLLEYHCLIMLLTDRSVVDVWDQPPKIDYTTIDGRLTDHTLDYLARHDNEQVIGYAVKPYDKVYDENGEFTEFGLNMQRVRAAAGHQIRIVTERSFSRTQIRDARILFRWSRQSDPEADYVVRNIIRSLNGAVPISTIRDLSGLGGRAFGAVVRAMGDGLLDKAEKKSIKIDTLVKRNG